MRLTKANKKKTHINLGVNMLLGFYTIQGFIFHFLVLTERHGIFLFYVHVVV